MQALEETFLAKEEPDIWAAPEVGDLGDFHALRDSAMQSVFKAFERASEGTLVVDRDARIVWISEKHARRVAPRPRIRPCCCWARRVPARNCSPMPSTAPRRALTVRSCR